MKLTHSFWEEFEATGHLSIANDFIDPELTKSLGLQIQELFKNPDKLYYHQKVKDLRQHFYVDSTHPHDERFKKLYDECSTFTLEILEQYFNYLKIDPQAIQAIFKNHKSFLRPNYYSGHPVGTILSDSHVDTSLVTLLFGGSHDGLEVYNKSQDKYVQVPTSHKNIIITFGSIMEAWTNGRIKATYHRVISRQTDPRTSFPFFFHPSPEAKMNDKYSTFDSYYIFKAKEAMLGGEGNY